MRSQMLPAGVEPHLFPTWIRSKSIRHSHSHNYLGILLAKQKQEWPRLGTEL